MSDRGVNRSHDALSITRQAGDIAPSLTRTITTARFSTIQVLLNTYSVSSWLIGTTLLVRVHAETLAVYRATTHLLTMPRLLGTGQHRIGYHHVIWSLVRKPGAFAHYRYRDDLFPSLVFRRAYDALRSQVPERADRHYVRLLHLAASTSEGEVELALGLLLDQRLMPPSMPYAIWSARPLPSASRS
jgi:hypothetical protein